MKTKRLIGAIFIYVTAWLAGVIFVTPPAASTILVSPEYQGLSLAQYGDLFVPMIVGAILASLLGGQLAMRWGLKWVYLLGLCFYIISMVLFSSTRLLFDHPDFDFGTLLTSFFFVGLGFGATVTTLNAWVYYFFPDKFATALTAFHGTLGIGTACAPLILDAFEKFHLWWIDPLAIAACLFIVGLIMMWALPPIKSVSSEPKPTKPLGFPLVLFSLLLFMTLYGIAETMSGNWGVLYMTKEKGISKEIASLGLSIFWGAITAGRLLTSLLAVKISPKIVYGIIPFILILGYLFLSYASSETSLLVAFGVTGLGASALFPLTIEFGEKSYPDFASLVSGRLMSVYMLGYGIAAWGTTLLLKETTLDTVFTFFFIIPLIMLLIAYWILFQLKSKEM